MFTTYFNARKRNAKRGEGGFTLVEMLVSVAIFTVFMLVAVSVVLSIIGGNRKAQAVNAVVNNLNFAIDSMVRDMKTGYFYKCEGDYTSVEDGDFMDYPESDACGDPSEAKTRVAFISVLGEQPSAVEYSYEQDPVTGIGSIRKTSSLRGADGGISDAVSVTLTPPDVDITSVRFYVNAPAPGGETQPSVFMLISGTARLGGGESDFMLQTFVSQRILNLGV
ncbi:MAG TPA: type II secretion system protein [Candidatus Paceibacterota bacterium]